MRIYGNISQGEKDKLAVTVEPHVMMRLKALFPQIAKHEIGTVKLSASPSNCEDLLWFAKRYPLDIPPDVAEVLNGGSVIHQARIEKLNFFRDPNYKPESVEMALPPRDYQLYGASVFTARGSMLLGDDVGLGKTVTALCSVAGVEKLPGVVVCQRQIARQWAFEQIPKFLPKFKVHIIKQMKPYDLPVADLYIITYSKLASWGDYFAQVLEPKTIIYDEVQELRNPDSQKYRVARNLVPFIPFRLGMSATPIYNYGDEMYNVLDVLDPGCLGDRSEFEREWCKYARGKVLIKDTAAFTSYLRENFIMLARTRKEVGRELPPVTRVTQIIPHDQKALDNIKDSALELAKKLLHGTFIERGEAARKFDLKMRQATGIAKAPHAADFINMLLERGQKVLVFAWHKEVYRILKDKLAEHNPLFWTGDESDAKKAENKALFRKSKKDGGSDFMAMSLRAAAGVDGLQDVCDICVYVEMDWSPGVHNQCTGRLNREFSDGRPGWNKCTEVFLLSDSGSDPIVANILGLKNSQIDGIMSPNEDSLEKLEVDPDHLRKLAIEYLKSHGIDPDAAPPAQTENDPVEGQLSEV